MDICLYSEEFRADLVAIWISKMNLPSSPLIRQQVKDFKKYFSSKARRDKISKLEWHPASAAELNLAVMSFIVGAEDSRPSSIIKKILSDGLD